MMIELHVGMTVNHHSDPTPALLKTVFVKVFFLRGGLFISVQKPNMNTSDSDASVCHDDGAVYKKKKPFYETNEPKQT